MTETKKIILKNGKEIITEKNILAGRISGELSTTDINGNQRNFNPCDIKEIKTVYELKCDTCNFYVRTFDKLETEKIMQEHKKVCEKQKKADMEIYRKIAGE